MAEAHRAALTLLLWLVTSCGESAGPVTREGDREPAPASSTTATTLEEAAIDAGVVADVNALSPVGLYRNPHEAGRDSLCVVKDKEGKLRFGLEAVFGENIECHGNGTARGSGDKLILNFARSACLIVARYEGDRVALPGALDIECRKLCSERGSLEGVTFPRVSREESVARDARARAGGRLCPD